MKLYVEQQKLELKEKTSQLGKTPILAGVLVGNREDSKIYTNIKKKVLGDMGMMYDDAHFKDGTPMSVLIDHVRKVNHNPDIHGILIQLPLNREYYSEADERTLINLIDPAKDVDGLTVINQYKLFIGEENNKFLQPCTPKGIRDYLLFKYDNLGGKNITVIGRSQLLGNSLAQMLMRENANVTMLHSKSDVTVKKHLEKCKTDIVCLCTGQKDLMNYNDIINTRVTDVIDAGISRTETGLRGDFRKEDYDATLNRGVYVSPVPGGVGTLTTLTLAKNLYKAYKLQKQ